MTYKKNVQKALRTAWEIENRPLIIIKSIKGQDSLVSKLIYDIFGGEILKTRVKKGWHFYNRIGGERLDFTNSRTKASIDDIEFEDIPSTPSEISDYLDKTDYWTFLMRFINSFEEIVGLQRYPRHIID